MGHRYFDLCRKPKFYHSVTPASRLFGKPRSSPRLLARLQQGASRSCPARCTDLKYSLFGSQPDQRPLKARLYLAQLAPTLKPPIQLVRIASWAIINQARDHHHVLAAHLGRTWLCMARLHQHFAKVVHRASTRTAVGLQFALAAQRVVILRDLVQPRPVHVQIVQQGPTLLLGPLLVRAALPGQAPLLGRRRALVLRGLTQFPRVA